MIWYQRKKRQEGDEIDKDFACFKHIDRGQAILFIRFSVVLWVL